MSTELQPQTQVYSFTLLVEMPEGITDEVETALFEAGCDDALLGTDGTVYYLDFDREAGSIREAMASAIANVEAAGVRVREVQPPDKDAFETVNAALRLRPRLPAADFPQFVKRVLEGERGA